MSKRILLITPVFYGLERIIKTELEKADYEVVWIENKILKFDYHGTKSKLRLLRRLYFLVTCPRNRYIKQQLNRIHNQYFDVLFAINGHVICASLFKKLKRTNPSLYSVLYLWDSICMYNWSYEFKYFKRVLTFDKLDSENFHIEYKPNFFISGVKPPVPGIVYDLSFIGKFNAYRYSILKCLIPELQINGEYCLVILVPTYKILFHNKFIYNILKPLNTNNEWILNYILNFEAIEGILQDALINKKNISYVESKSYLMASNVILDLPYEKQSGYTHRVIEALGNGKKVITSNRGILKEPFYNPEQIQLVDPKVSALDTDWIKERREFKVDNYVANLELKPWLESILNVQVA